ncbi:MAG: excinuclease ABC subunit UvrC [Chloroflexi bacterium]|nr:excinuclease ABC subunit UvrC [Chloroflexota bacterium]
MTAPLSSLAEQRPQLAEQLRNLPDRPGVYLFKDGRGRLLYVGKAESLKDRVRSYFQPSTSFDRAHQPKLRQMVAQAQAVEYILTDSPIQALIWENDLVRKEQPRYNTKLRDDKHYPYIRIDVQNPWPVARVSRRIEKDGARYFGPFPHATSVRQTLDTLSRLFPQILCSRTITGTDARACLYYHIKRCPAPCIGAIDNTGYRELVDGMVRFLDGKNQEVIRILEREMEDAAENLEFERAADLRDRLAAARKVVEQEKVGYTTQVDQDVLGLARDGGHACVQLFLMRDGQLARRDSFLLEDAEDETESSVLTSFVTQYYARATDLPAELVLPADLENAETIAEWLRQVKGRRVELTVPRRGDKRRIVELAARNARDTLEQQKAEWLADAEKTGEAAFQLQEALGLPRPPRRIECYDISHVQGTNQVASMVVFEDGKPNRAHYKRFKIKHQEGNNDFLSMQEVIRRRFRRALDAAKVTPSTEHARSAGPYLLLDAATSPAAERAGGDEAARRDQMVDTKARPGVALSIDLPVLGRRATQRTEDGHRTGTRGDANDEALGGALADDGTFEDGSTGLDAAGLDAASAWGLFPDLVIIDGGKGQLSAAVEVMDDLELSEIPIVGLAKENEEIFLKGRSDPVILPRTSQALYLVQRIRDEAHRFAITYHRKIRTKSGLRSQLEDVPGVGPTRKKALLRKYGSLKAIRAASVEDLAAVSGMSRSAAVSVKRTLGET